MLLTGNSYLPWTLFTETTFLLLQLPANVVHPTVDLDATNS